MIKRTFMAVFATVSAVAFMAAVMIPSPAHADWGVINVGNVTVNDGIVLDGVVTVKAASVATSSSSWTKAVIFKTSDETMVLTAADGLSNAQLGEPQAAARLAKALFPEHTVMLVDEVGGYDSDGDGKADDR